MKTRKTTQKTSLKHHVPVVKRDEQNLDRNPAFHRRILNFLNEAVSPEALMFERSMIVHNEAGLAHQGNPVHEDNPDEMKMKRKQFMSHETAKQILELREREFPLGFRNIKELTATIDIARLRDLFHWLSDIFYGRWETFPQPIPRRGPGGIDGVVHAALCHRE